MPQGQSSLSNACDCCNKPPCCAPQLFYVSLRESCVHYECGARNMDIGADPCKRYSTVVFHAADGLIQTTTYSLQDAPNAANPCAKTCHLETTCEGGYTQTDTLTGSSNYSYGCDGDDDSSFSETSTGSSSSTFVYKRTYHEDCTHTDEMISCSGTSSSRTDRYGCGTGNLHYWYECQSSMDSNCHWFGTQSGDETTFDSPTGSSEVRTPCTGSSLSVTTYDPARITPYTEYLDEESFDLCTPCPEQNEYPEFLPPSFGGITGCRLSPGATYPNEIPQDLKSGQFYFHTAYDLSINGEVVRQKIRFKVGHSASGTCYQKVWLRKVIQKYKQEVHPYYPCLKAWVVDGDPTYEALPPYEWEGGSVFDNLCYDPTKISDAFIGINYDNCGYHHCDNYIVGSHTEITANLGESIGVEVVKVSCVRGYEPPDHNREDAGFFYLLPPNGFPVI